MSKPLPSNRLLWSLEELATEEHMDQQLVYSALAYFGNRGQRIPGMIKIRILLKALSTYTGPSEERLYELNTLNALVTNSNEPDVVSRASSLTPPPELILQIKTELVAKVWRSGLVDTHTIVMRVREIFGHHPDMTERPRYEELISAAQNSSVRLILEQQVESTNTLAGVYRFLDVASKALPPTTLAVIENDINRGRYIPGAEHQPTATAAAAAGPSRSTPRGQPQAAYQPVQRTAAAEGGPAAAGDYFIEDNRQEEEYYAELVRRASVGAGGAPIRELHAARQELHMAGGGDPLQAAERLAAQAPPPRSGPRPGMPIARSPIRATPGDRPRLPESEPGAVPPLRSPVAAGVTPTRMAASTEKGVRRQNVRWSDEEVDALIEGVRKRGPGAWAAILTDNRALFQDANGSKRRTAVDLKDKWRNITVKYPREDAKQAEEDYQAVVAEQERQADLKQAETAAAAAAADQAAKEAEKAAKKAERAAKRKEAAECKAAAEEEAQPAATEEQPGDGDEEEGDDGPAAIATVEEDADMVTADEGGEGEEGEEAAGGGAAAAEAVAEEEQEEEEVADEAEGESEGSAKEVRDEGGDEMLEDEDEAEEASKDDDEPTPPSLRKRGARELAAVAAARAAQDEKKKRGRRAAGRGKSSKYAKRAKK